MNHILRRDTLWTILLIVSLWLAGCATRPPPEGVYVVNRGDTLYSIAFSHGLDYHAVARWNGIRPPYLIHPEQHIKVRPPNWPDSDPTPIAQIEPPSRSSPLIMDTSGRAVIIRRGDTLHSIAERHGVDRNSLAQANGLKWPYTLYPDHKLKLPDRTVSNAAAPTLSTSVISPAASNDGLLSDMALSAPGAWAWPVQGRVVRPYQSWGQGKKGIGIAGELGDPVRASSAGRVVYSGGGLFGYGELIIIKHSLNYLSAYGHNRRRLVVEGAQVKQGQVIAELGQTGTTHPMLHFEIRRSGKPINPLAQLPH